MTLFNDRGIMGLLYSLKEKYKTLSIVGMAKNSGKTTTLNHLIEEAMDEGIVLGITSTGRDGESSDLVTGTEKPKVFLYPGTIVTVPTGLYDFAEAGLEILKMTNYRTPLGNLMICAVVDSGYVQIAGPLNIKDHKKLCDEILALGVDMIIIDGAIDRKSIAAPETSDAIILATGAVISRTIKNIVEETAHIVRLYESEVLEDGNIRNLINENMASNKIFTISNNKKIKILNRDTGLGGSQFIDEMIDDDTEYIFIPGALTKSVIADINQEKLKRVKLILKDPTKIFIDYVTWQRMLKKGFNVLVMDQIKVAAVTVNPLSPQGYCFDSDEIIGAMKSAIKEIPVLDVKKSF